MTKKYFIKTFGCQLNIADSERIATFLEKKGMKPAENIKEADYIVINSCAVRQSAENRVYGLARNLSKLKNKRQKIKIILTGCMTGMAFLDKTGKTIKRLKKIMPCIDEFLPINKIGFEYPQLRNNKKNALVVISSGCNNFCSYCIVPYARGRETSRPYECIIKECQELKYKGYEKILLLGQNVNSYGADLILKSKMNNKNFKKENSKKNLSSNKILFLKKTPIMVKHLGRFRIPTLFPYLLEDIAKMGFKQISFLSCNPWDFSDELIDVIARNKNISRIIHLPVQSGDDEILKKMNRWYTSKEYIELVKKLRKKIPDLLLTTDIIVGFPGETEEQFQNTVLLCKKVKFFKAYIAQYSPRPFTSAIKKYKDDVPASVKKERFEILDKLINRPHLAKNAGIHKY